MATETTVKTEDRRLNGLAISANADAVKKLKENHSEEFGALLREARVALGLAAEAGGESTKKIQDRYNRQMEKLQKLQEELAQRGVTVTSAD